MPRRPAPIPALVVALAVAVTACSSDTPEPTPTARETIAEVRTARETVAGPAVALHEAVQRVVALVEERRRAPEEDPAERLAELRDVASGPFDDLEAAVATAEGVELDGRSAPVRGAAEALRDAADAAEDVLREARRDLATQEQAAAAHSALLSMAARWDAPGSRSQQLHRLAELAGDADGLAEQLAGTAPVAPCLTTFERRRAAARHVAAATRELRDHVEAYRGREFDELREELAEDPFALERPLVAADLEELECWRAEAPVVAAAAAVDDALERLEAALNPPGPSPTPTP